MHNYEKSLVHFDTVVHDDVTLLYCGQPSTSTDVRNYKTQDMDTPMVQN